MRTYKARTRKGSYKSSTKRSIRVLLPTYNYTIFQHTILVFVEHLYILDGKKADFSSAFFQLINMGFPME